MTPTRGGRHCAACQQTVIDFTEKTDAEILALLAQVTGSICGRFGTDQLRRPLVLPEPAVPRPSRWPRWLAAAATAWVLRETPGLPAAAQAAVAHHAQHPRTRLGRPHQPAGAATRLMRGVVRDSVTHEPLPDVAVFMMAENRSATTDSAGRFRLQVSAGQRHTLVLHRFGHQPRTVHIPASGAAVVLAIALPADAAATGAEITGCMPRQERRVTGGAISQIILSPPTVPIQSAAWHPSGFFQWLMHPFRGKQAGQ